MTELDETQQLAAEALSRGDSDLAARILRAGGHAASASLIQAVSDSARTTQAGQATADAPDDLYTREELAAMTPQDVWANQEKVDRSMAALGGGR